MRLFPKPYVQAEIDCNARDGHLASISSEAANTVVSRGAGFNCARDFWLGGWFTSDAAGMWSWTDGSRFSSFSRWAYGELPNRGSLRDTTRLCISQCESPVQACVIFA